MIQTSKRSAMTAAGGLTLCLLGATVGSAAEIKVLSSVALTSALNQTAPSFEQATGNKLNISGLNGFVCSFSYWVINIH